MDRLGNTLEIENTIKSGGTNYISGTTTPTIDKLRETYRVSQEIIENLDDLALAELCGGNGHDVDDLLAIINEETYRVLYGDGGTVKESSVNYLKKLSENIEETLRIENFNYFITSVLHEFEVNWHHLEWGDLVMHHNKLCVLAPRDHGKSYFFSNAYPLWKMYRYRAPKQNERNARPDLQISNRGFILTSDMDLSEELMEIIKANIEENDILREKLWNTERKEGWKGRSIRCKNGARLGLKSAGSKFRGRHPGWIVVDNFLSDSVIYSKTQREKATNYFHSVIMNAVLKKGQVLVVDTPFHDADTYAKLKQKRGWKVFEYPAIFPDGKILWRNRYNFNDLMDKKEDQGNIIFSREILVRPIVSDSSIFPYDILRKAFVGMDEYTLVKNIDSFPVKFTRVVTGCDFAISANIGADYSVFGTWGIDEQENMWLLHMWRDKGKPYDEQIAVLKSINLNFNPDVIYMETNQFQMVMKNIAENEGLPVFAHNTGTNKYDFKTGLPGVAILFQRGKIKLPRGDSYSIDTTDLMCAEFASVTWTDKGLEGVGEHDDIAMMTWVSSLAAKHAITGFGVGFL